MNLPHFQNLPQEPGSSVPKVFRTLAPYGDVYSSVAETVEIVTLPAWATVPNSVIARWPQGSLQQVSAELGFTHSESRPSELTAALKLEFRTGVLKSYLFLLGGPELDISFPFSKILGLENRSAGGPEAMLNMKIDPSSIKFISNHGVSDYKLMQDKFRSSLSHPGVDHVWSDGPGIYTRFRVSPSVCSNEPGVNATLYLEACILPGGAVWNPLTSEVRKILRRNSSYSIVLWSTELVWYSPDSKTGLITSPCLDMNGDSVECPLPTDAYVRFCVHMAIQDARKGGHLENGAQWTQYIEDPGKLTAVPYQIPPYKLVLNMNPNPTFRKPSS